MARKELTKECIADAALALIEENGLAAFSLRALAAFLKERILRSVMHGFFAHEHTGGFTYTEIDRETSYRMAIHCVAGALNMERKQYHEK